MKNKVFHVGINKLIDYSLPPSGGGAFDTIGSNKVDQD